MNVFIQHFYLFIFDKNYLDKNLHASRVVTKNVLNSKNVPKEKTFYARVEVDNI